MNKMNNTNVTCPYVVSISNYKPQADVRVSGLPVYGGMYYWTITMIIKLYDPIK